MPPTRRSTTRRHAARESRCPSGAVLERPTYRYRTCSRTRATDRGKRSPYPLATVIVGLVGLAIIGWMLLSGGPDAPSDGALAATGAATLEEATPEREPTPFFASYRSLQLRLPVDPTELTALAFHQAAGTSALSMTSLVPDADMELANELKAAPQLAADADLTSMVWPGSCLRLWRSNRGGEPDTAADFGADPGTAVWSPVTGVVVQVRPYRLYDKHDDFEIHIRPDGWSDVDVVLIHVDDVAVEAGDRVFAGATRIASVRKMSDKMDMQLAGYTSNGGDHVHLQLNLIEDPARLPDLGES